MSVSSAGWYGLPADAFQGLQQRMQEFSDWTVNRYQSLVDAQRYASSDTQYRHLCKRKTRLDLIRMSMSVCGIEFCYAAETAFVSPALLKIGIPVLYMTLIWCLSPAIGFFLVPFLGSCSDRCHSTWGRRRPFILLLSIGIIVGLIIVPHGSSLGYLLGDKSPIHINETIFDVKNSSALIRIDSDDEDFRVREIRPIGVILTIVGVMALDLCADSCQSPARAYLLDVCLPEDHARGLSMFTAMAGIGGGLGYILGAVHWEQTGWGAALGGQEAAVFFIVLVIYLICLVVTLTSFAEMPLALIDAQKTRLESRREADTDVCESYSYTHTENNFLPCAAVGNGNSIENELYSDLSPLHNLALNEQPVTLRDYLWSIIYMPSSLRVLCLTNLCCWMSLVCYSLYFTDFVGQSVFGGDPTATRHSNELARQLYEDGVRFGCWGMAIYSISCAGYSAVIEKLIFQLGAKKVYVGGQLIYSIGMFLMAITRNQACVIIFSATAGIMYSTLFTMPFFLVAHYHSSGLFDEEQPVSGKGRRKHVRGLGTDVATVSSMVFLAQFILSSINGTLVHVTGTPTATVIFSAILSCCGAFAATKVTYLSL